MKATTSGHLDINRLINWKQKSGSFYDLYGAEVVKLIHHKFTN
jgi:hypothetical protein